MVVYYAVQKAVEQTLRATNTKEGDRKVGVVWHTQGSLKFATAFLDRFQFSQALSKIKNE
jgi:type I site-specific restriction-modification system R (restriction) subunit